MLNELDDRLSVVKRWGIMRTIQTQSVAEHAFNVQRICVRIAPWFKLRDMCELFALSQGALHHDDVEALTGDIPTYAKYYLRENEKIVDTDAGAWYDGLPDNLKAIIKLADLLEAFNFLAIEVKMGNRYVIKHRSGLRQKIHDFIREQNWPTVVEAECRSWMVEAELEPSRIYGRREHGLSGSAEEGA